VLHKRNVISVAFFVVMGVFGSEAVFAQLKLGYIDSQKIVMTYTPAVEAQKKWEGERNSIAQELQKMVEELRASQASLEQQSLLLSEAKKREKTQELQEMDRRIQEFQQEKDQELLNRREELLKPVYEEINAAIQKIKERDGYDLIFDATALLEAKEQYDLTDIVLKELGEEPSKGDEN